MVSYLFPVRPHTQLAEHINAESHARALNNATCQLVLASLWLLHIAVNQWLNVAIVQLLAAIMLLYDQQGTAQPIRQGWRLLRWLLLPLLLLHMLFTPGTFFIPGIPVSREGVNNGLLLAVHLAAMVYAAMLLSRLITLPVLWPLASRIPVIARLLPLYLHVWPELWQHMQQAARHQQQRWHNSGKHWRQLPGLIADMVVETDRRARAISFPEHSLTLPAHPPAVTQPRLSVYLLALLLAQDLPGTVSFLLQEV